jgi:hypothetical protein
MLDAGYWILDTGCWMLDAGYWILDAGYWILDAGCWILDTRYLLPTANYLLPLISDWLLAASCKFRRLPNPYCRFELKTLNSLCYLLKMTFSVKT